MVDDKRKCECVKNYTGKYCNIKPIRLEKPTKTISKCIKFKKEHSNLILYIACPIGVPIFIFIIIITVRLYCESKCDQKNKEDFQIALENEYTYI